MVLNIIIPCYNVEKYLDNLLKSIYFQDADENDFSIILVDDGSNDTTWNILHKWSQTKSNLTIIQQNNSGVSAARNRGIEEAKVNGQYIWFIDADDYIVPGALSLIINRLKSIHPEIIIFKNIKRVSQESSICDEEIISRLDNTVVPSTFSANNVFSCIYNTELINSGGGDSLSN